MAIIPDMPRCGVAKDEGPEGHGLSRGRQRKGSEPAGRGAGRIGGSVYVASVSEGDERGDANGRTRHSRACEGVENL